MTTQDLTDAQHEICCRYNPCEKYNTYEHHECPLYILCNKKIYLDYLHKDADKDYRKLPNLKELTGISKEEWNLIVECNDIETLLKFIEESIT